MEMTQLTAFCAALPVFAFCLFSYLLTLPPQKAQTDKGLQEVRDRCSAERKASVKDAKKEGKEECLKEITSLADGARCALHDQHIHPAVVALTLFLFRFLCHILRIATFNTSFKNTKTQPCLERNNLGDN